jgi:anti-sigma factor RsiW
MSEHATTWLEAYYDGELEGRLLSSVEDHLSDCTSCQEELKRLNGLSSLLQLSPGPEGFLPVNQFVAQVGLRMPPLPEQPMWQRVFSIGWQFTPVGVFGLWSFFQTVFLVAGIIFLAANLGVGGDMLAGLIPSSQAGPGLGDLLLLQNASLNDIIRTSLDFLRTGGPFGWGMIVNLGISFTLGLLYCSWLASWWIRKQSSDHLSTPLLVNSNGH